MTTRFLGIFGLGLSLSLAACGGESASATPGSAEPAPEAGASGGAIAAAVPATGRVIEVKMITEGASNHFEPASVEAKQGDVLRFTLVSGVHNVSFPSAQNAGASGLPAASAFLQLPGETVDVPVTFGPGEYAFQCDPHAALGMVGRLKVQ